MYNVFKVLIDERKAATLSFFFERDLRCILVPWDNLYSPVILFLEMNFPAEAPSADLSR